MPEFTLSTTTAAPVEEVWKLLHDPSRFPEWWSGIETVRSEGPERYTIWPQGYPDYPMAQQLRTERTAGRVTISCLVSDLEFVWQLVPDGRGTRIEANVEIPAYEAHRLGAQRALIEASLDRLAALAAVTA